MKKFLPILFLLIVFVCGCSPSLSRDKAKSILQSWYKNKSITYNLAWDGTPNDPKLNLLVSKGLLIQKRSYSWMDHFPYTLTNTGKQFSIKTMYDGEVVKIADYEIDTIDGITINSATKVATVEYTYKYKNLTPFAPFADGLNVNDNKKVNGNKTEMILYDDGWRIKED